MSERRSSGNSLKLPLWGDACCSVGWSGKITRSGCRTRAAPLSRPDPYGSVFPSDKRRFGRKTHLAPWGPAPGGGKAKQILFRACFDSGKGVGGGARRDSRGEIREQWASLPGGPLGPFMPTWLCPRGGWGWTSSLPEGGHSERAAGGPARGAAKLTNTFSERLLQPRLF